jgi:hypothetical protein
VPEAFRSASARQRQQLAFAERSSRPVVGNLRHLLRPLRFDEVPELADDVVLDDSVKHGFP